MQRFAADDIKYAYSAQHAFVGTVEPGETFAVECVEGWSNFFRKPEFPLVYTVRLGRRFEPEADVRAMVRKVEDHYWVELRS